MCRFFGLRATAPTTVECCLVHARNSLLAQSRRDLHGFDNADGWGIATYDGDGRPHLVRDATPAHLSEDFRIAARQVDAATILAHVRRATVGAMTPENTHPFAHGSWAFVHNGTIPYFDAIRGEMLAAMTPAHRAAIQGATDSEHLFHLILSALAREPARPLLEVVHGCLSRVLGWCREIGPHPRLGLNILLTDGGRMVGSRWQRTLFHLERRARMACGTCGRVHPGGAPADGYRAAVIASEPITQEPWGEVPERSVYEVTPEFGFRIEPLRDD